MKSSAMASFSCHFPCLLLPASLLLLLFFLSFLSIPPLLDLSQATEAFPLASSIFPITSTREDNKPMKAIFIEVRMEKKKKGSPLFSVVFLLLLNFLFSVFILGFTEQKKKKKTSLRMIEASLAEARASIRNAVLWKNFTSQKKETYIPRGSIYRNAYAFHQLSLPTEKGTNI